MDDASVALSFLLAKNSYIANETLAILDELNNYRKTLQEEISKKAESKTDINDNAVIVWGENWQRAKSWNR
jgi:single-stranded-DNA-specific exonuclease